MSNAIDSLKHCSGSSPPSLDLVVISHFDHDHVSGLIELLQTFTVRTLLLPYLPLWKRLILILENDDLLDGQLKRFLLDPAAYLNEQKGVRVEQIVFVPNTRKSDSAPEITRSAISNNSEPLFNVPTEDAPNEDIRAEINPSRQSRIKVSVLKRGKRLSWGTHWEFLPYNDSRVSCRDPKLFRQKALALKDSLIHSKSPDDLKKIKQTYDTEFGKTSKSRNIISLFLYIGLMNAKHSVICHAIVRKNDRSQRWAEFLLKTTKAAVIYTGDGYLDTDSRIQRFKKFYGPYRFKQALCLQVMHHGSKNNWQPGLAGTLQPHLSVFSSDPERAPFNHPDGEVLRDFWPYTPVQTDKQQYLTIDCWL
ncbi:MAG: hypothetical protein ACOYBR_11020 [Fluviibacter sp.]